MPRAQNIDHEFARIKYRSVAARDLFDADENEWRFERDRAKRRHSKAVWLLGLVDGGNDRYATWKARERGAKFIRRNGHS